MSQIDGLYKPSLKLPARILTGTLALLSVISLLFAAACIPLLIVGYSEVFPVQNVMASSVAIAISLAGLSLLTEGLLVKSDKESLLDSCKRIAKGATRNYLLLLAVLGGTFLLLVGLFFDDLRYGLYSAYACSALLHEKYELAAERFKYLESVSTAEPARLYIAKSLRAHSLNLSKKHDEAVVELKQVIDQINQAKTKDRPILASAQCILGDTYRQMKHYADAEAAWEACRTTISDAKAANELKSSMHCFGGFTTGPVHLPAPPRRNLAQLYFEDGKYSDAERICNDALADPEVQSDKKEMDKLQNLKNETQTKLSNQK